MSVKTVDAGAPAPANNVAISPANMAAEDTAMADGLAGAVKADNAKLSIEQQDERETADLMKVWQKHNPDRYSDGKFAPKEAPAVTDAPAAPEAAAATEPVSADPPKDAKVEQAKPAIDPPLSWSADMKAKWAALPPELQTYVAQRDKETHNAYTQSGQKLKELETQVKAYEPFDQLIQANKDNFARRGVAPAQAFAVLLEAQRQLDANPLAGLVQIGLGYGIDLRPVLQGQAPQFAQQAQVAPDPLVAELEARNRGLEQRVASHEKKIADRETAEKQATIRQGESIVEKFKAEKDKSGNLLRPYFDDAEVQDYICLLVQNGKIAEIGDSHAKLEAAYDQAVHALPNIRQRIQEDQRKADEAKRTAEAKAKADEARKSNSVNVRSAPAAANPKTEDDTLHEIAAKYYPGYRKPVAA